jgi:hypothetical protein
MEEQVRCQYCNRPLKTDESVMNLAGPVCKKKAECDHDLETCPVGQAEATGERKDGSGIVSLKGIARPVNRA